MEDQTEDDEQPTPEQRGTEPSPRGGTDQQAHGATFLLKYLYRAYFKRKADGANFVAKLFTVVAKREK